MFKKSKKEDKELQMQAKAGLEDMEDFDSLDELEAIAAPAGKKKKLPPWAIIPVIGVVAVIGVAGAMASGQKADKGGQMETVKAEREDVRQVYNTTGTVGSDKEKVFYCPVNAPIAQCNVKVGQVVKAGDLLVSFDTTNLERDNQQSELNTLSAKYSSQDAIEQSGRAAQTQAQTQAQVEAGIQSLKAQIQQKQADIDSLTQAAQSAGSAAAANAQKVAELKGEMQKNLDAQDAKKAELENLQRELDGMDSTSPGYSDKLNKANTLTNEIADLSTKYRALDQQYNSIGSTDDGGMSEALIQAQAELDSLKASLAEMENSRSVPADTSLTGAQLNNLRTTENLAELAQLTTEELLAKGREGLKAEFDGIISDVKALEGNEAAQGMELFTLVDNKSVNVILEVPANDFDNLVSGSKATIKIGKSSYKGTLVSVDKIALPNEKGNPTIGAKIRIDNADDDIVIGVSGKVAITVDEKKNVVCLPNEVVNTSTDGNFVYIIQNGTVKKQFVELGIASNSKVEIVKGLKEGTEVVSDTSGSIKEGMKASDAGMKADTADKE